MMSLRKSSFFKDKFVLNEWEVKQIIRFTSIKDWGKNGSFIELRGRVPHYEKPWKAMSTEPLMAYLSECHSNFDIANDYF